MTELQLTGSSDSVLAQRDKISGHISSVAELHYIASSMKKATECQDASTNTDTELPSEVPQVLPPDVFLNLRYSSGVTPKPISVHPTCSEPDLKDLAGHRFINMVDISATDILNDLPEVEQINENVLSKQAERIPSTPELPYMAASVTRPVVEKVQHRESIFKQPWSEMALLEPEPKTSSDELTQQLLLHDSSVYSLEQSQKNVSLKQSTKYQFSEKFHEMDVQLSALQNLAENLELDFANTRLLVNTIESIGVIANPHVEANHVFPNTGTITEKDFETTRREPKLFVDDALHLSRLSDVADIITDLVKDRGVSASELGLSEAQTRVVSRLASIQDVSKGQISQRKDRDRKEIREWMKKKWKERSAEYQKKLTELRESEHTPFKSAQKKGLTSKSIKQNQKIKEEKDKLLLSEHHEHRVLDALDLMNEMLTETVQIPNTEFRSSTPRWSARSPRGQIVTSAQGNYSNSRSLSASRAEKNTAAGYAGLGRTRSLSLPPGGSALLTGTKILQKKTSALRGRPTAGTSSNVQSRPVSSLPWDQISQIAQRRMLTDPRRPRSHIQGRVKWQQGHSKRVPTVHHQASQCSSTLQRPDVQPYKSQTQAGVDVLSEEDELVSVWSPPDEIRRILDKSSDTLLQDTLVHEDGEHAFNVLNAEGMDDISDSTGSILSKLDWNAVENMVANMNEI